MEWEIFWKSRVIIVIQKFSGSLGAQQFACQSEMRDPLGSSLVLLTFTRKSVGAVLTLGGLLSLAYILAHTYEGLNTGTGAGASIQPTGAVQSGPPFFTWR